MRAHFILLLSLITLVSCSGKAPSKTSFSLVIDQTLAAPAGGLVIFGTSTDNKSFARTISTSSATGTIQEEIPKGTWSFGAVAWSGTAAAFTGDISCAFQDSVGINTDVAKVDLKLTNANCFNGSRIVSGTNKGLIAPAADRFNDIHLSFCEGTVEGRSATDCQYSPTIRPIEKGFAGSYKMHISAFRKYGDDVVPLSGEFLSSRCYNTDSNSEPATTPTYDGSELNIPAFLQGVGFPLEVRAYLGSVCEEAKGFLTRSLQNPAEAKVAFKAATLNWLHVSTPAIDLCNISDKIGTVPGPASGNGTLASPWLICSEKQLLHLQKNFETASFPTNVKDGVYVLGRDMDLLRFIKGGDHAALQTSCIQDGDTFVPIGKDYTDCSSNFIPSASFHFDGNGYFIRNFRFKSSGGMVGFFHTINGNVYDVNFSHAEVEGGAETAVAIGKLSMGLAKMINVYDSRVEGDSQTGSVIGNIQSTSSAYQLHAFNVEIEGGSFTGGLVGQSTTTALFDVSFSGSIYAESNSTHIGGIAGMMGANITRASSSGVIRTGSQYVGGIAGTANTITYAKSDMLIKDYNTSSSAPPTRDMGGIAGNASNVDKSFFMGKLSTACISGCNIGSIAGNASAGSYTHSLVNYSQGNGEDGASTFTLAQMRSDISGLLTSLNTLDTAPFTWSQVDTDVPRLPFESGRSCANAIDNKDISQQLGLGRGSSSNPVIICTNDQVSSLDLLPAGKTAHLRHDIYMDSLGGAATFSGIFDGQGKIIHSYLTITAASGTPFIGSIQSGATFKNTKLSGFEISKTSSCVNCNEAGLAGINEGLIENVFMEDLNIYTDEDSNEIGGVVNHNKLSGVIKRVSVYGDIRGLSKIGGIVYKNEGTVKNTTVEATLNLGGGAAVNVGGIVGLNKKDVFRNRFKGEIKSMGAASSVGGIVGSVEFGSSAPRVMDNEVDLNAKLMFTGAVFNSGGIVGSSDNSANVIARNISSGFILNEDGEGTVTPIVGDGGFTDVFDATSVPPKQAPNKAINPDNVLFSSNIATLGATPITGDLCQFTIDADNSGAGTHGALYIPDHDFFMGPMTEVATVYTMNVILDSSRCTSLHGTSTIGMYFYSANSAPDSVTSALLKSEHYDIADMINSTTDRDRAIAGYVESIKTNSVPANAPVWIFDEEGYGLFHLD